MKASCFPAYLKSMENSFSLAYRGFETRKFRIGVNVRKTVQTIHVKSTELVGGYPPFLTKTIHTFL